MTACLLLVLLLVWVDAAGAASSQRRLCSRRANLYDTPSGVVVGRLYRPQTVRIIRRSANHRWVSVRVRTGLSGWLLLSKLCHA